MHEAFRLFSLRVLKYLSVHMKANNCREAEEKGKPLSRNWGAAKASLLILTPLLNAIKAHPFKAQANPYETAAKDFPELIRIYLPVNSFSPVIYTTTWKLSTFNDELYKNHRQFTQEYLCIEIVTLITLISLQLIEKIQLKPQQTLSESVWKKLTNYFGIAAASSYGTGINLANFVRKKQIQNVSRFQWHKIFTNTTSRKKKTRPKPTEIASKQSRDNKAYPSCGLANPHWWSSSSSLFQCLPSSINPGIRFLWNNYTWGVLNSCFRLIHLTTEAPFKLPFDTSPSFIICWCICFLLTELHY